jgi:hypothetical protein
VKTFPIPTEDRAGVFAFEIENIHIDPAAKLFSKSSDIHVEFLYHGEPCIVWEPYGDSSRYWIGPKDETTGKLDVTRLEEGFKHYYPPLHRAIIGDCLTLRFIGRFFEK